MLIRLKKLRSAAVDQVEKVVFCRLAGCKVGSSGWLQGRFIGFKKWKSRKMVGFSRVSEDPFGTFPVSEGLYK